MTLAAAPPALGLALVLLSSAACAQDMGNMPGMSGEAQPAPTQPSQQTSSPTHAPPAQPKPASPEAASDMSAMPGMTVDSMDMSGMMAGQLGGYSMMRDASGTAWQPDSTPMEGLSWKSGGWTGMVHGYADLIYDHQGGPRGDTKTFSESMFMVMAQHAAGPGTLTLRSMLSLDPAMGASGYPLLLQTGETADGVHAADRPPAPARPLHGAGRRLQPAGRRRLSAFLYVGYPGEPALGPATFMHRFSGMDDPAAPITHHWLGLHPHHLRRRHRRLRARAPSRSKARCSTAASRTSTAGISTRCGSIPTPGRLSWNPTAELGAAGQLRLHSRAPSS